MLLISSQLIINSWNILSSELCSVFHTLVLVAFGQNISFKQAVRVPCKKKMNFVILAAWEKLYFKHWRLTCTISISIFKELGCWQFIWIWVFAVFQESPCIFCSLNGFWLSYGCSEIWSGSHMHSRGFLENWIVFSACLHVHQTCCSRGSLESHLELRLVSQLDKIHNKRSRYLCSHVEILQKNPTKVRITLRVIKGGHHPAGSFFFGQLLLWPSSYFHSSIRERQHKEP